MKPSVFCTILLATLLSSCSGTGTDVGTDTATQLDKSMSTTTNAYNMDGNDSLKDDEFVYWINSTKVNCTGVAPMKCLQVQKGEQIDGDKWQLFYSAIKGFNYEQGFVYKIIVREFDIPAHLVPADASSVEYTFVEMLEKNAAPNFTLNGVWVLDKIRMQTIDGERKKMPTLEIDREKMKVSGNDGCNRFFGSINHLDQQSLVFGPIASTRMLCHDMTLTNQFNNELNRVESYTVKDSMLYLQSDQGDVILTFKTSQQ